MTTGGRALSEASVSTSAAVSTARDREAGTLEVLFYGPVDEISYVLGKVKDNNSLTIEGGGSYPRSSWDPDIDWGPADFDVRHRVNLSFVYDLPRSESFTGFTNALLNDGDEPFVFYLDGATGRGAVVYRRYDGHYGLIEPVSG